MQLRARQAKERAARLRGTWLAGAGGQSQTPSPGRTARTEPTQRSAQSSRTERGAAAPRDGAAEKRAVAEDEPLDEMLEEGRELYEWTQALTVSSLGFE